MIKEYQYSYKEWKFFIEDLEYGRSNVVHMKNKFFPGMRFSFLLGGHETSSSDLGMNVLSQCYNKLDEALLHLKLQTIGET